MATNTPESAPSQGSFPHDPRGHKETTLAAVDAKTAGCENAASERPAEREVTTLSLQDVRNATKSRSGSLTPTNAALGGGFSAADENLAKEASEPSKRQTRTRLPVYEDFDGVRHKTLTPVKAIRAKCVDCCCHQWAEVRRCPCPECALWPYRFGRRPKPQDLILPEER